MYILLLDFLNYIKTVSTLLSKLLYYHYKTLIISHVRLFVSAALLLLATVLLLMGVSRQFYCFTVGLSVQIYSKKL